MRRLPVANPPNRFAATFVDRDGVDGAPPDAELRVVEEEARSILSGNDSPDLLMKWSLNPYRGCQHACSYCYARPSHQYWGFGAGTDFDRTIVVKVNAPELLRATFDRRSWVGEPVTFSGNTDCYQPLEGRYRLTRRCLEVCLAYRNPVHVVTKSAVVLRDLDVLSRLARDARCSATVSIAFADDDMGRAIEPYAAACSQRFEVIRALTDAGVATGVNVAPVIPGLSDDQVPEILARARAAGAVRAAMIPLRLPAEVQPVFLGRLQASHPDRAARVESAVRQIRFGKLDDSRFGHRMVGDGPRWQAVEALFAAQCRRLGLDRFVADAYDDLCGDGPTTFERPGTQRTLF